MDERRVREIMTKPVTKSCTNCGVNHYFHEFYKDKRAKDGLSSQCKSCILLRCKEYRKTHKRDRSEYHKRPEVKLRAKQLSRIKNIKSYGLTPKQHLLIYADQNGCCAICEQAIPYSEVYIDHNHQTGKVRGLLCMTCNTHLGVIEKKEFLEKAQKYLVKHEN